MLAGRCWSQLPPGLVDEFVGHSGHRFGIGTEGGHRFGRDSGHLRVGVGRFRRQRPAPEHGDEAVFLHRPNEYCRVFNGGPIEEPAQLGALFSGDPPRPAVCHVSIGVDSAEVASRGNVPGLEVEVDAHRLQHSPPDIKLNRVIAKQSQVSRGAARSNAWTNRVGQSADSPGRQSVQVRFPGRLQLRLPGVRMGQSAQPVDNQQDNLLRGWLRERLYQVETRHR